VKLQSRRALKALTRSRFQQGHRVNLDLIADDEFHRASPTPSQGWRQLKASSGLPTFTGIWVLRVEGESPIPVPQAVRPSAPVDSDPHPSQQLPWTVSPSAWLVGRRAADDAVSHFTGDDRRHEVQATLVGDHPGSAF